MVWGTACPAISMMSSADTNRSTNFATAACRTPPCSGVPGRVLVRGQRRHALTKGSSDPEHETTGTLFAGSRGHR
jgi:hypothetical protein